VSSPPSSSPLKQATFLLPITDLKESTQRYYEIYSIFSLIYIYIYIQQLRPWVTTGFIRGGVGHEEKILKKNKTN
jgi:hypothetical protein